MRALLLALLLLAGPAVGAKPLIQGSFRLTDARNGKDLASADLKGKVQLVYFGFTHCRLACPIGLHKMDEVLRLLGADAAKVAPIFITTDPERDTAVLMRDFSAAFNPAIIPLVGKPKAIASAMRSFRLEAQKTEQKSADEYQMDHPAIFYVMDRQGRFAMTLSSGGDAAVLAAQLRKALK